VSVRYISERHVQGAMTARSFEDVSDDGAESDISHKEGSIDESVK
jgi:hypothetical protein